MHLNFWLQTSHHSCLEEILISCFSWKPPQPPKRLIVPGLCTSQPVDTREEPGLSQLMRLPVEVKGPQHNETVGARQRLRAAGDGRRPYRRYSTRERCRLEFPDWEGFNSSAHTPRQRVYIWQKTNSKAKYLGFCSFLSALLLDLGAWRGGHGVASWSLEEDSRRSSLHLLILAPKQKQESDLSWEKRSLIVSRELELHLCLPEDNTVF